MAAQRALLMLITVCSEEVIDFCKFVGFHIPVILTFFTFADE